jgi:two-component sensor histidine kinase
MNMPGELDAAITFVELRELFDMENITSTDAMESEFDQPHANTGGLFPIAKGLLQAAEITEDLVDNDIIAVDGGDEFVEAFKEFESGDMDVRLLEVLACNGCIMGPGSTACTPRFSRRAKVSAFVKSRLAEFDKDKWVANMETFADLNLTRKFKSYDQRVQIPIAKSLDEILSKMGKFTPEDELNCGACGYETCRAHAVAIYKGLAENEMCLPFTIEQLHRTNKDLATSNKQLATTQEALMQSEKLASMGQLAAGIAHEVNNPLGVVLMYSHLLLDENGGNPELKKDLTLITEQADRCKKIVAGLLNFARRNKVLLNPTDIYELAERCCKTIISPENVSIEVKTELDDKIIYIDRDQISQVMTNLLSNAIAAMPDGGQIDISISEKDNTVDIEVADNGGGIPKENLPKIFEPFFTTKPIGEGTGLGLAVTYGIAKMHRGDITVESNAEIAKGPTGTKFTVTLPRNSNE